MQKVNQDISSNNGNHFKWYFQSNPNPFDPKEDKTYKAYDDEVNKKIENYFLLKAQRFEINETYFIDFNEMKQFNKNDLRRQRPVVRREIKAMARAS
jgi:hypothetical protein